MTLYETLKKADKDTIYHIGTRDGSGFLYVGKADEFDEARFNRMATDEICKSIDQCKRALENANTYIIPSPVYPMAGVYDGDVDAYCKACEKLYNKYLTAAKEVMNCANNVRRIELKLKTAEKNLRRFVPFARREVFDTYARIQGDGDVIIINGTERGKYWSLSEYQAGYVEEDENGTGTE